MILFLLSKKREREGEYVCVREKERKWFKCHKIFCVCLLLAYIVIIQIQIHTLYKCAKCEPVDESDRKRVQSRMNQINKYRQSANKSHTHAAHLDEWLCESER